MLDAPFSIVSYGSASYGYNRANHGKLDDLDFFLVISRETTVVELLHYASLTFLTKMEASETHIESVLKGDHDICRMYGIVDGIKVGFRVICHDTFTRVCSKEGACSPVRNINLLGQTHVINEKEWNFKLGRYVDLVYKHEYVQVEGSDAVMIEHYCFSRKRRRLGTLGRKFLSSTLVYEAETHCVQASLQSLWSVFSHSARHYQPGLSAENIVSTIFRSERFSPEFKVRLCKMVPAG